MNNLSKQIEEALEAVNIVQKNLYELKEILQQIIKEGLVIDMFTQDKKEK